MIFSVGSLLDRTQALGHVDMTAPRHPGAPIHPSARVAWAGERVRICSVPPPTLESTDLLDAISGYRDPCGGFTPYRTGDPIQKLDYHCIYTRCRGRKNKVVALRRRGA